MHGACSTCSLDVNVRQGETNLMYNKTEDIIIYMIYRNIKGKRRIYFFPLRFFKTQRNFLVLYGMR